MAVIDEMKIFKDISASEIEVDLAAFYVEAAPPILSEAEAILLNQGREKI